MKYLSELIKSFLAGLMISLGGIAFLSNERVVGALLFTVGLCTVVFFKLSLYTGKVGYLLENDKTYCLMTLLSICGNFLGCLFVGFAKSPIGSVVEICTAKLGKSIPSALFDGFMCGILIYVSVEIYKKKGTFLGILVAIPAFILCGFEHSIADMFYFVNSRLLFSSENGPRSALFLLVIIVGNAIGGLLIPALLKTSEQLETPKKQ